MASLPKKKKSAGAATPAKKRASTAKTTPVTLSCALIVRNEESEIAACLQTLKDADEIVVVDTGSIDKTMAVVRDWAKKHFKGRLRTSKFEWVDDFSAARNYAASLCKSEWIFHIDADMRLSAGGINHLKATMRGLKVSVQTLAVIQVSQNGNWRNRRVLCHRRGKAHWVGTIHEAMSLDDHVTEQLAVVEYGYSASHEHDPDRNLRILRKEADKNPTPRVCYYLGSALMERNKDPEALKWLGRCAKYTQWRPEKADALLLMAKIHWRNKRGNTARTLALESLIYAPECKETLLLMADMSFPVEGATWTKFASIANNERVLFARK